MNTARARARRRTVMTRWVGGLIALLMILSLAGPVLGSF